MADEVVQEVFVHLWVIREKMADVENPSAYLYKMTGNRCLDKIRRQETEIEMQYVASAVMHGTLVSFQEGQYDLRKIEGYIREAVALLPEQRRIIYTLQQEQQLSYQEIADKLSISRHTVRNQMAKTLQSIRSYLLDKGLFYLILFNYLFFF
jgi:RNA polymerase sigma factor (sigma-70 family)